MTLILNGILIALAFTVGYFLNAKKWKVAAVAATPGVLITFAAYWDDMISAALCLSSFVAMIVIFKILFEKV